MIQGGTAVGVGLLVLLAGALGAQTDTTTYVDAATRALIARARARHLHQDSLVRDYQARITTRLDVSAGRSRFARQFPLVAHETTGRVSWRRPNDLRLDVEGVRVTSAFRGVRAEVGYDRPWFVPRALGDSIRLMGVPETAALHPLAPGADRYYHYAIDDSVLIGLQDRTIRAIAVRVMPKELAPAMVAGDMWIDAETADVVRLMVTFLGEYLWDTPDSNATPADSARARKDNRRAQRFVTVQADLEYSLHENRFWMPYRQSLTIVVDVDFLIRGTLPIRAITTFRDYQINADAPLAFDAAPAVDSAGRRRRARTICAGDSAGRCDRASREERGYRRVGTWENGRWEVAVPPADSVAAYAWTEPLTLDLDASDEERLRATMADLSRLAEDLPGEWVGRSRFGVAWERAADVVRFNRVQGYSFGLGTVVRPGPAFTALYLDGRFGLADHRVTGSLTWRREAPDGILAIRGFRAVREPDPWSRGQSLGNSINATFTAHDDADYYLALGGSVGYTPYHGPLADVDFAVSFERQRSMESAARAGLNDLLGGSGDFPVNPSVLEGDFVGALVSPHRRIGSAELTLGLEGLVGETATGGRAWAAAKIPLRLAGRTGALSLKTGHTVGDSLPQLWFRVGGPATVRGYPYATCTGAGMWAAQLDFALSRRWLIAPVVFVDVGDTFDTDGFAPLVGVGGGVSFFGGWMRLNGSFGVNPSTDFRFDLLFGAAR